jgi:hypothetical protein
VFSASSRAAPSSQVTSISFDDLNDRPVIGRLGQPLGRCMEIEATLFNGDDLRTKGDEGRFLLRVIKVNGQTIREPVLIPFVVPGFVATDLFTSEDELDHKRKEIEEPELTPEQFKTLVKTISARTQRLCVYEEGGFSGMPATMPKDAPGWQDHGFGFGTWLVVLVDRSN